MILPDQGDGESVKMFVSDVGTTAPPRHSLSSDGQTGCYSGREVRLTGNLGPGHKAPRFPRRSEEHTSELQSQSNLVCRLLLEKKKTKYKSRRASIRDVDPSLRRSDKCRS